MMTEYALMGLHAVALDRVTSPDPAKPRHTFPGSGYHTFFVGCSFVDAAVCVCASLYSPLALGEAGHATYHRGLACIACPMGVALT